MSKKPEDKCIGCQLLDESFEPYTFVTRTGSAAIRLNKDQTYYGGLSIIYTKHVDPNDWVRKISKEDKASFMEDVDMAEEVLRLVLRPKLTDIYHARLGVRHFMHFLYPRYEDDELPGGIHPRDRKFKQIESKYCVLVDDMRPRFAERLSHSHSQRR